MRVWGGVCWMRVRRSVLSESVGRSVLGESEEECVE